MRSFTTRKLIKKKICKLKTTLHLLTTKRAFKRAKGAVCMYGQKMTLVGRRFRKIGNKSGQVEQWFVSLSLNGFPVPPYPPREVVHTWWRRRLLVAYSWQQDLPVRKTFILYLNSLISQLIFRSILFCRSGSPDFSNSSISPFHDRRYSWAHVLINTELQAKRVNGNTQTKMQEF